MELEERLVIRPREIFPVFRARLNWPPPLLRQTRYNWRSTSGYIITTVTIVVIAVDVTAIFYFNVFDKDIIIFYLEYYYILKQLNKS